MVKIWCTILIGCLMLNYTLATFSNPGGGENLISSLIRGLVPNAGIGPSGFGNSGYGAGGYGSSSGGCPLCDSSVYSYCSDKMLHDACCCNGGIGIPYNCQATDCSFLNSNSCYEHSLIVNCCCNSP